MWKVFILFFIIYTCNGSLTDFKISKYESPITDAVTDIVNNFFVKESSTINIVQASSIEGDSEQFEDIINEVLCMSKNDITVQIEEFNKISSRVRKMTHNIFFCDTYESFEKILLQMDPNYFDYQGFYLIVITQQDDNLYETMVRICNDLWSRYIVNANILWASVDVSNDILMYTYYPFMRSRCSVANPVQLNHFHDGKWVTNVNYFPNKMTNLFGCPLLAASFSNPPFMIIRRLERSVQVDGIDGILMQVLARKMNFNVQLFIASDGWGEIYDNGTTTGN